ncbi:12844_t:CDS:2, partial [Acaulospora morrowiae]
MSLNYAVLAAQNVSRKNTSPDQRNAPRIVRCYHYEREGHYFREYSENASSQSEEEGDMDAYVVEGIIPTRRERPKHKPEKEESLVKKVRRKREPSVINSLDSYNVADDILALPVTVTIRQMLQYPKTTTTKCYAKIERKPIIAVLDSGATTPEETDISDKDSDTCDKFEYESEELKEKKGYYMEEQSDGELYKNPWENMQSPAIYMTTLEKEEQKEAMKFFEKEKNLFVKDITELTQTNVIHH